MKKEILTTIRLSADEGFILTNGKSFGEIININTEADEKQWQEITVEEYKKIKEEQAKMLEKVGFVEQQTTES